MSRFVQILLLASGQLLYYGVHGQEQLECYSCSYNLGYPDDFCMTDPTNAANNPGTVRCNTTNGRTCYIKSQYDPVKDEIRSFQRGCEIFEDEGCVESSHYTDCLHTCHEDYCNGNQIYTTPEPYTGSTEEDDSGSGGVVRSSLLLTTGLLLVVQLVGRV